MKLYVYDPHCIFFVFSVTLSSLEMLAGGVPACYPEVSNSLLPEEKLAAGCEVETFLRTIVRKENFSHIMLVRCEFRVGAGGVWSPWTGE